MKRSYYFILAVLVFASMLLASCGPTPATPAATPAATSAPVATATSAPVANATAACAPKGNAGIPFPSGGKSVTIAFSQEPDLVDVLFSSMSYSAWVAQMTVVGLATWDSNNNLIPLLATDIPTTANGGVSADGLTITWHLKPCLFWSDGQPLTSADVKFTEQVITDPGNAVYTRAGYDQITSVDTPDPLTAVLHFKSLYPGWQTLFTSGPNNQGSIQPMHILQGKTGLEKDPYVRWPTVASGPWLITDWVAGDHMTMLPNPNWFQGHPKLDQIQIKFVPDPETALAALKTGDVDFVPDFAESDIATLQGLAPAIQMRVDPGPEFEHYLFNLGTQGTGVGQSDVAGPCPLQDVNVRKAIIMGIDRQTLVTTLLYGKTTVPATLWPNSSWTDTNVKDYPFDPTQAQQLLTTAGYTPGGDGIRHGMCNGKDTRLSFNFETTDKQIRKDYGVAVQAMLLKIGVEFKPSFIPSGTFFGDYAAGADMATGKFDMAGYTTGFYPDPYTDNFLCSSVVSKQNQGGDNNYHLCDPKFDALNTAVNASADPAVRKQALDAVQQYMVDNALVIPMYARANVMGYDSRLVLPPTSVIGGMLGDTFDWDIK
ncbi:MAG: peptide ABC transporter substrate-binding protein [Anaerolineales bacterium]